MSHQRGPQFRRQMVPLRPRERNFGPPPRPWTKMPQSRRFVLIAPVDEIIFTHSTLSRPEPHNPGSIIASGFQVAAGARARRSLARVTGWEVHTSVHEMGALMMYIAT